jgi:predicted transcriptional regulator
MIRVLDGRNFNFTLIENELIDDIEKFDKNDLLCYMVLCRYANNSTGECYPSYKTIAEKMRVGVSTAMKAIKSLESKGVIEISSRKNETGGDTSNLYTIKDIKQYYENKKASTGGTVKASNTNKNNIDTNIIPQNNKKYSPKNKENKNNTGKGASANVNNTFMKYKPKELESMLEDSQKGKFDKYKNTEEENRVDKVNITNENIENKSNEEINQFIPQCNYKYMG